MNARMRKSTKLTLKTFRSAVKNFDMAKATKAFGSKLFAKVYLASLESEIEVLEESLKKD